MAENKRKVIALAGNPNSGKTTLFNNLTGATAYVGNWPGVTVEKRSGTYKDKSLGSVDIVDLPGIYSLSPYTPEEVISRDFVLEEKPDCVIDVIDATNLERNLYLTTQLLEMDVPVVIALNMTDLLAKDKVNIDERELSAKLGVPVISVSALKNQGIKELMKEAIDASERKRGGTSVLSKTEFKAEVEKAYGIYSSAGIDHPLFHAIKALENDSVEEEKHKELAKEARNAANNPESFDSKTADARYKVIAKEFVSARKGKQTRAKEKLTASDKIDRVLTNKWAGIPIFLLILLLVFSLTFSEDLFFLHRLFGVQFTPCFEGSNWEGLFWSDAGINSPGVILFNALTGLTDTIWGAIETGLTNINTPEWVVGLLGSVINDGFFAVLGFVPQIMVIFFFFSILEDSGYMARVAFVFDRIFRKAGLSGRAFIPMLMGYGCGVPAMINTRTLNTDKERTQTIRVIAFFCCGAKVTAVAAIAGVLAEKFGWDASLVGFSMYVMGIVFAIAMVVLMHWTTQREKVPPFIMELPAYHLPQWRALGIHMWDKLKHYLKKASTIIVLAAVIIWVFSNFTVDWKFIPSLVDEFGEPVAEYENSIIKSFCQTISPVFTPLGFGVELSGNGWALTLASMTGLVAKEIVADTFAIVAGGADNVAAMVGATGITLGGLVAFLVFNLTTVPCFAAIATAKAELPKGTMKWTVLFWLGSSYVFALITRLIFDFVWTIAIIVPVIVLIYVLAYLHYRKATKKEEAELAA